MNIYHTRMHSTRLFILDCLWVCRKIRPSVGTSDHHRNFRGGSSQGLCQSSEEQIHVSTLCQNFWPPSEVPVQCSQRLGWMFRSACMFRRTVGTSDPRWKFRCGSSQGLCECSDSQLHVLTHYQKFQAWEFKFEFCKSF